MNDQANGSVGLTSAQTAAAATAPATKAARGTTTDNPVIAAAAKIDKILKALPTEAARRRVLGLIAEEYPSA